MTLNEWMKQNDVTDAALAERIGVSRPFITRIRNGKRQPSLPVALKLSKATRLPIKVFIREVVV